MNTSNLKKHYHSLSRPVMLLFFLLLLIRFCSCTNTITPNQPLSDGHVVVSTDENFALGFFSPANSSRRYVGIWYNKISPQTVVWVANRDNPTTNTSGVLSINKSGNLVLFDSKNPAVLIWSTNLSVVESDYSAQLLDSGNLVVFQVDSTKGAFVWQTFDFPTDTLLPNMKLGVDRRSGLNRFLTSWKSEDNPGTGSYSYMINVSGSLPQMNMYKSLNPYWRGGPWSGFRWTGVPEMQRNFLFNITYTDSPEEVSVVYSTGNTSIISRVVLNGVDGTLKSLTWDDSDGKWVTGWVTPKDPCDYFGHCGAFGNCNIYNTNEFECKCVPGFEPKSPHDWYLRNGSQGCVRKRGSLVCGNGEGFVKLTGMKLPDTTKSRLDINLSSKACAELCLKNCSCTGYAGADVGRGGSNGCITWYGELVDLTKFSSGGQDFYVRVDAAELAQYSKKSKRLHGYLKVLLLGLLIPAYLVLITLACWLIMKKKKGRDLAGEEQLFSTNNRSVQSSAGGEEYKEMGSSTVDVKVYSLTTIIAATENFSYSNKIGEGGFGSVYKGKLQNGQEIAVKRLSNTSGQGIQEFRNEVTLIAKLQHRNLVRLLGYCIQKEEKMLIYEYLPNKGLDCFLFDKGKRYMLDWKKRFDIVLGIAQGMVYLHHHSRLRIIHRDLKASNVLLDASLNPKISDFGMARIFGGNQVEERTKRVVGTYGYMSPEYAMEGLFSIKSDVFSFGVLLLEIITGRKNNSYYMENSVNLIGHVWDRWRETKVLEVGDPSLSESHQHDSEILRCIHIGLLCVQESAKARPSMSEVIFMLCNETSLPTPGEAAFIVRTANRGLTNTSSTSAGASSVNEVTNSMIEDSPPRYDTIFVVNIGGSPRYTTCSFMCYTDSAIQDDLTGIVPYVMELDVSCNRISVVFIPILEQNHWWSTAFSANRKEIIVIDSLHPVDVTLTHQVQSHELYLVEDPRWRVRGYTNVGKTFTEHGKTSRRGQLWFAHDGCHQALH